MFFSFSQNQIAPFAMRHPVWKVIHKLRMPVDLILAIFDHQILLTFYSQKYLQFLRFCRQKFDLKFFWESLALDIWGHPLQLPLACQRSLWLTFGANGEIQSIGRKLKLFGVYYELFPDYVWERCHTGACARRRPNTPESNRRADPVTAVPRFDLLRVTGRAAQGCSTFGEGETRRFAIVRVLD